MCVVTWAPGQARVGALMTDVDDALLVAAVEGDAAGGPRPSKVAVDAPLGWPVDFVRGVADPAAWPVAIGGDRRRLERRATDHWVHEREKKQPLSVTTDRIGYAAMRAAGLLAHLAAGGEAVDRSGASGRVCETTRTRPCAASACGRRTRACARATSTAPARRCAGRSSSACSAWPRGWSCARSTPRPAWPPTTASTRWSAPSSPAPPSAA